MNNSEHWEKYRARLERGRPYLEGIRSDIEPSWRQIRRLDRPDKRCSDKEEFENAIAVWITVVDDWIVQFDDRIDSTEFSSKIRDLSKALNNVRQVAQSMTLQDHLIFHAIADIRGDRTSRCGHQFLPPDMGGVKEGGQPLNL